MKKAFRILLYMVVIVSALAISFIGFIEVRGVPKYDVEEIDFPQVPFDSAMLMNGEKIAAVQCVVCHRGSDGKLSGRLLQELPPDFGEIHSANITQSKEHGIGKWTDAQIAYLLRTGVKPDGQFLPPYMPKFPHLSEYDLKSVLVFLHSNINYVQASEIPKVQSKPSFLVKFLTNMVPTFKKIPYPFAPIPEPDTNDLPALGKYLVTGRYDCYPCHSRDFKTMNMTYPEKSEGYLGGGNRMMSLDGKERFTANITPDEATGIGSWTKEDFANAMLHSKNKSGHTLREPMLPYNGMTNLEIDAIWKYLETVPAIKNKVDRKWAED
ncbi:MAG: cytochrome c [Bacteroidetes bacterium]|nr:cytochrome c [Bacteroidota bacterium]